MRLALGSYAYRWSVGTPAYPRKAPARLEDLVKDTARLGCTVLQIADSSELDSLSESECRGLRDLAENVGIQLQTGLTGMSEERMLRYLELTTALGGDLMRVVIESDEVRPGAAAAESVLRSIVPRFEDLGVSIAIENHFLTPSPELVRIIEGVASAAVGVCLDTANSVMCGEWPEVTFELLAPYAICMHLKDYAVVPHEDGVGGHIVGRPLGDGWLDIPAAIAAVQPSDERLNGRLAVVIEQWLPLQDNSDSTIDEERRWRALNVARAREYLPTAELVGGVRQP